MVHSQLPVSSQSASYLSGCEEIVYVFVSVSQLVDEVLTLAPPDDHVLNMLLLVLKPAKRAADLQRAYEAACSKDPNNAELLQGLFGCHVRCAACSPNIFVSALRYTAVLLCNGLCASVWHRSWTMLLQHAYFWTPGTFLPCFIQISHQKATASLCMCCRSFNFQSQQQIAMKLNKTHPNELYQWWVITSLALQAHEAAVKASLAASASSQALATTQTLSGASITPGKAVPGSASPAAGGPTLTPVPGGLGAHQLLQLTEAMAGRLLSKHSGCCPPSWECAMLYLGLLQAQVRAGLGLGSLCCALYVCALYYIPILHIYSFHPRLHVVWCQTVCVWCATGSAVLLSRCTCCSLLAGRGPSVSSITLKV